MSSFISSSLSSSLYHITEPLSIATSTFWPLTGQIFAEAYTESSICSTPRYKEIILLAHSSNGNLVGALKAEAFTGGLILRKLAVSKSVRRQHLGSALLATALQRGYSVGARIAVAEVFGHCKAAHTLFHK